MSAQREPDSYSTHHAQNNSRPSTASPPITPQTASPSTDKADAAFNPPVGEGTRVMDPEPVFEPLRGMDAPEEDAGGADTDPEEDETIVMTVVWPTELVENMVETPDGVLEDAPVGTERVLEGEKVGMGRERLAELVEGCSVWVLRRLVVTASVSYLKGSLVGMGELKGSVVRS